MNLRTHHRPGSLPSSLNRSESAARGKAGFTLVEIMVVVFIAALVMAVSVPFVYRSIHKEPLSQASNDLMEACHHARAYAILKGVAHRLVIRSDGQISVQSVGGAAPSSPESSRVAQSEQAASSGSSAFQAHFDPDQIMVPLLDVNFVDCTQFDEASIRFHPNGTSDEFTIVLQSPEGQKRVISLDIVTGLADMEVFQ